jgi:Anti-sigma-28 factor, FlgM
MGQTPTPGYLAEQMITTNASVTEVVDDRAVLVEALRRKIDAGEYRIDPGQIADAVLRRLVLTSAPHAEVAAAA